MLWRAAMNAVKATKKAIEKAAAPVKAMKKSGSHILSGCSPSAIKEDSATEAIEDSMMSFAV